jgi:hypothetical protein
MTNERQGSAGIGLPDNEKGGPTIVGPPFS